MDTGDLSDKTYKAIMIEAERFSHNLTLQFGLLSYECDNEKEFVEKSKNLIEEIRQYDQEELDNIFFGDIPQNSDLHKALNKLITNITALQRTLNKSK